MASGARDAQEAARRPGKIHPGESSPETVKRLSGALARSDGHILRQDFRAAAEKRIHYRKMAGVGREGQKKTGWVNTGGMSPAATRCGNLSAVCTEKHTKRDQAAHGCSSVTFLIPCGVRSLF